jgi:hypothetical protein
MKHTSFFLVLIAIYTGNCFGSEEKACRPDPEKFEAFKKSKVGTSCRHGKEIGDVRVTRYDNERSAFRFNAIHKDGTICECTADK